MATSTRGAIDADAFPSFLFASGLFIIWSICTGVATTFRCQALFIRVPADLFLPCVSGNQCLFRRHRKPCCRPYTPQPRCACYLFDCDAPPASDRAMRRRRLQAMFSSSTEFPPHRKEDYFIILREQRHRRNDRVLPHPRAEDRLGPDWTRPWPAA